MKKKVSTKKATAISFPEFSRESRKPSQSELAELMARLAVGRKVTPEAVQKLAVEALYIWNAAESAIQDAFPVSPQVNIFDNPFQRAKEEGIDFPEHLAKIPFEGALKLLMPQRRSAADRMKYFRDYLKETNQDHPDGAENGAVQKIESLKSRLWERYEFYQIGVDFLRWHREKTALLRSEAGKKGGKASAAKKKA